MDNIESQKSYDLKCNNTLAHTCNAIDNIRVSNAFFTEITEMFILKVIKSHFLGHMINRIVHAWLF